MEMNLSIKSKQTAKIIYDMVRNLETVKVTLFTKPEEKFLQGLETAAKEVGMIERGTIKGLTLEELCGDAV